MALKELERRGIPLPTNRGADVPLGLAELCEASLSHGLDEWQKDMCRRLDGLKPGDRVIIHAPPGSGKTILIAQRWPVELIAQDPTLGVRLIKFSAERAILDSTVALGLAREFYPWLGIPTVASAQQWYTSARKGQRDAQPSFQAMGLGSGAVGSHGGLWIVDDPYANEAEAYSATVRGNIAAKWRGMYESRFKAEDIVVLMFHRWHDADLAGDLIRQGGWQYWRYAAVCDSEDDLLGRQIGELLTPRYTQSWIDGRRIAMGSAEFDALFQGEPHADGGGLLDRSWFTVITPAEFKAMLAEETGEKLVLSAMGADLAVTKKTSADFTVALPGAVSNRHNYFWLKPYRKQEEWPQARRDILERMKGSKIRIVGMDATGTQRGLVQDFSEWAVGVSVVPIIAGPLDNKEFRVRLWNPIAEQRRIFLVDDGKPVMDDMGQPSTWSEIMLRELSRFPMGRFDDQVDAASNLMEALSSTVEPSALSKLGVVRPR